MNTDDWYYILQALHYFNASVRMIACSLVMITILKWAALLAGFAKHWMEEKNE